MTTRLSEVTLNTRVGWAIRKMRQHVGLSQHDLASQTGVAQSHISKRERGKAPITLHDLELIAEALGCKAQDLFEGSPSTYADGYERGHRDGARQEREKFLTRLAEVIHQGNQ